MKIDKKLIKELVNNLKEFELTELDYQEGQTRIKVSKASRGIEVGKTSSIVSPNKSVLKSTDESEGIPGQAKTVQEIFDVVIESSIVGLRKPDVRIYELALKEAGNIKANEAVFLDDIGANLKPARKMGIHTIRVMVDDVDGIDALIKLEKIIGEELFVTGRPVKSKL